MVSIGSGAPSRNRTRVIALPVTTLPIWVDQLINQSINQSWFALKAVIVSKYKSELNAAAQWGYKTLNTASCERKITDNKNTVQTKINVVRWHDKIQISTSSFFIERLNARKVEKSSRAVGCSRRYLYFLHEHFRLSCTTATWLEYFVRMTARSILNCLRSKMYSSVRVLGLKEWIRSVSWTDVGKAD